MREYDLKKGQKIKLFLRNGYHFQGELLEKTDEYLVLKDSKDSLVRGFNFSVIARWVIQNE